MKISPAQLHVCTHKFDKLPCYFFYKGDKSITDEVFVLRPVTVDCTVPTELDFGSNLDQEWKLNGNTINTSPTYNIIPNELTVSGFSQPGRGKKSKTSTHQLPFDFLFCCFYLTSVKHLTQLITS